MIEPPVCVPSASRTCPSATAAAEPLLDPPGVRPGSCGLRVGAARPMAPNSTVSVLPKISAPAGAQQRHAGRIHAARHAIRQVCVVARRHVRGQDDVLDAHRHAVQRTPRARLIQRACVLHDQRPIDMRPCAHIALAFIDAPQRRLRLLHGGHLLQRRQKGQHLVLADHIGIFRIHVEQVRLVRRGVGDRRTPRAPPRW